MAFVLGPSSSVLLCSRPLGSIVARVPELSFRDLQRSLRQLGLGPDSRVLVHADLPALGPVRGGAATAAGALAGVCGLVVAPAFTPQCRVWPLVGPSNNGVSYAGHEADNANAEIFRLDLPADPNLGPVAEALRHVPGAVRSPHPLYSFTAVGRGAQAVAAAQSLAEPLGPIAHLAETAPAADVLLLGAGHVGHVAIHYAEARAGRKQFIRWALTRQGVAECAGCPGCADGFGALTPHVAGLVRSVPLGLGRAERLPLAELLRVAEAVLRRDPAALLCVRPGCERCAAVRAVLAGAGVPAAA